MIAPQKISRAVAFSQPKRLDCQDNAHGLLQNLSVQARGEQRFEVVAGARRHAALRRLAKEGKIARDFAVPCNLVAPDGASETSLAENVHRVAMNAMDEADAFAALIDQGLDADAIAARFGVATRHVEQRIALAHLSPKLKASYRRGEINFDAARAFTIEPDHAKQDAVLRALGKPILHASQVRALLTQGAMKASDRIARFVGLESYEEAGGALIRDLFDPDTVFVADPGLMTRLADARMEAIREELIAQGWGWVDVDLGLGGLTAQSGQRIQPTRRPMTRGERRALAALDAEIATSETKLNDPEIEDDALWTQHQALEAKRQALITATEQWDKELIAHAGTIVRLDHEGRAHVTHGIVAKADAGQLKRILAARAPEGQAPDAEAADRGDQTPASTGPKLSKALARELTTTRSIALREAVSRSPDLALGIIVYAGVKTALQNARAHGVELTMLGVAAADADTLENARMRLTSALPSSDAELLDWCLAQSRERLLEALAILIAGALDLAHDAHTSADNALQGFADRLASALDLDMRAQWAADIGFLSRLPKSMLMQIAADAPSIAAKTPKRRELQLKAWAKMKRDDLAKAVAKALDGAGWLPDLLITPVPAGALVVTDEGQAAASSIAAE